MSQPIDFEGLAKKNGWTPQQAIKHLAGDMLQHLGARFQREVAVRNYEIPKAISIEIKVDNRDTYIVFHMEKGE